MINDKLWYQDIPMALILVAHIVINMILAESIDTTAAGYFLLTIISMLICYLLKNDKPESFVDLPFITEAIEDRDI